MLTKTIQTGVNTAIMHSEASVKKIGLVVKADAKARQQAGTFSRWLVSKGLEVIRRENSAGDTIRSECETCRAPAELYCIFVLGGDGTFLSAVRWIGDQDIPVVGVKFGEVGFLAEITEENLYPVAEAILANHFQTHQRMRLVVEVRRQDTVVARETVLNDAVINKGALARLADIRTLIDDHYLTTYRADGLIVATPTGSTAYSLAAGGPVVHPSVPGIVMTPICPFTLTNRPLIVPDNVTVSIQLDQAARDIMLTCDGQAGFKLSYQDTVVIRKSAFPVRLISIPGQQYFDVLKAKLRWSGGRV